MERRRLFAANVAEASEPDGSRDHGNRPGHRANTAIFSVVNSVILQPLPYEEPQQLVNLATEQRDQALDGQGSFSIPDALDVQQSSQTLEHVAIYQQTGTIMTEGGEPERLIGAAVNADYFPTLRVKPILGRVFTRDEDKAGAPSVVLISHGLWQRRYGGDPNIVGPYATRKVHSPTRKQEPKHAAGDRQEQALGE